MNLEYRFFYEAERTREAKRRQTGLEPGPGPGLVQSARAGAEGLQAFFEVLQEELYPYVSEFNPGRMARRASEGHATQPERIGVHGQA